MSILKNNPEEEKGYMHKYFHSSVICNKKIITDLIF